jgi:hypothetical protein
MAGRGIQAGLFLVPFFFCFIGTVPALTENGFPEGPGAELVDSVCTYCHSARLVLQNRMTRNQWEKTIRWMQKEQGLWEFDPEEEKLILDYLGTHLSPEETDPTRPNVMPLE